MTVENSLSPIEQVQAIVSKGLTSKGRKNRRLYRQIRHALKLAHLRGYRHTKEFFEFFSRGPKEKETGTRLVRKLLSYVSLTEFLQLTAQGE